MTTFVELSTKARMPIVGLGTWKVGVQVLENSFFQVGSGSGHFLLFAQHLQGMGVGILEPGPSLLLAFVLLKASKLRLAFPS